MGSSTYIGNTSNISLNFKNSNFPKKNIDTHKVEAKKQNEDTKLNIPKIEENKEDNINNHNRRRYFEDGRKRGNNPDPFIRPIRYSNTNGTNTNGTNTNGKNTDGKNTNWKNTNGTNTNGKKTDGKNTLGKKIGGKLELIGEGLVEGFVTGVEGVVGVVDYVVNDEDFHDTVRTGMFHTFNAIKDIDLENTVFKQKDIVIKKKTQVQKLIDKSTLNMLENKNKAKLLEREIDKMQKKEDEKEEEENKEKKYIEEGSKKWTKYKEEIRLQKLREINYIDLVEEIVMNNYYVFKEKIIKEIEKIYSQEFKELTSELIKAKRNSIFQKIKNNLKEIKSLNFMIAGLSGTGKTTLTNTLLNINEAKESNNIDPETSEIKSYSNPKEFPGLTLYDTIGVEPNNLGRNLSKIKEMIKDKFDENLKDPDKALHGVLYCIKNSLGDSKILKEEISYIKELNNMYGDGNIVMIVFTQSMNDKTESRKNQLKEKLNNENIEIIEVLCRERKIFDITIKAYGIDKLKAAMRNKAKNSLIKTNIKQIAKQKIKEKYLEEVKIKYKELKKKFRQREIESSFLYRLKYILENILGEINPDFKNIENIINNDTRELKKKIMKILKAENDERIRKKINNEFINFNAKYDNLLIKNIDDYENYLFNSKFKDYLEPKVEEEIKNILFEKSAIIFMEKSIEIISNILSEEIKDEEIQYLVDLSIKKFFQKDD